MMASHCHVDAAVVKGANGAAQEVGEELVKLCEGSVLALATIGNHLHGKTTPDEWTKVKENLANRLRDDDPAVLPTDYPKTVFAVYDMVLEKIHGEAREVVSALWLFAPGVPLPLPLLKLAVQVETQREWADLDLSLEKIVRANLLEVIDGKARHRQILQESKGKKEYRLLDLVGMWLTKRNEGKVPAALVEEPHALAGPSSHEQAGTMEGGSAVLERQDRCTLLANFLTIFGTPETGQQAFKFLAKALGLDFGGLANAKERTRLRGLSHSLAIGLTSAYRLDEGPGERAVLAEFLARIAAAAAGYMPSTEETLRVLDKAHSLDPNNADILKVREHIKCHFQRSEDAVRDPDKGDRLAPNDPRILYWRGQFKSRAGNLTGGQQDLDEVKRLDPSLLPSWYSEVEDLERKERLGQARGGPVGSGPGIAS
jgi:tetratricopeptide (TPR) repeat protein